MTSSSSGPSPGMKICPFCAEEIREAAVKCRFCHSYLTGSISERGAATPEESAETDVSAAEAEEDDRSAAASSSPAPPATKPRPKSKPSPAPPKPGTSKTAKSAQAAKSKARRPAAQTRFPALAKPAVAIVLSVLVVAVLAADAFLLLSWHGYRQEADARASGQVAAVNDAEKILSFNYKTVDKTTADAKKLMTPSFRKKYADTADRVAADAPKTKAIVKAQVVASSVVSAKKDKVKTLLFVNQTTTRNDLAQPRVDLNRVELTLVKDGDGWLVDNIQAL